MRFDRIDNQTYLLEPGPVDVHTHPRAFDGLTDDILDSEGSREGKAGLRQYSETALRSGLVAMLAMPNETLRRIDSSGADLTETIPYPISNLDKVLALQQRISTESAIPTGIILGIDPTEIFLDEEMAQLNVPLIEERFDSAGEECMALKVFMADTFGGFNIPVWVGVQIARIWHRRWPGKPLVAHVEGENLNGFLGAIHDLPEGDEIALHIAHVSSRQELESVTLAKAMDMNVTSEVTPHHLGLSREMVAHMPGYKEVRPGIKPRADIAYLRAHVRQIDIISSDCAPHRGVDKRAGTPGFANHSFMLPLLMGMVKDGDMRMQDIYEKLCIKPRARFNLPYDDDTRVVVDLTAEKESPRDYDRRAHVQYEANPLRHMSVRHQNLIHLAGRVVSAESATSSVTEIQASIKTSYRNLIRPAKEVHL